MLVSIAAYCLVLGAIAASAGVASKGKSEARRRNISANAQVRLFFILSIAILQQDSPYFMASLLSASQRPPPTPFWCDECPQLPWFCFDTEQCRKVAGADQCLTAPRFRMSHDLHLQAKAQQGGSNAEKAPLKDKVEPSDKLAKGAPAKRAAMAACAVAAIIIAAAVGGLAWFWAGASPCLPPLV